MAKGSVEWFPPNRLATTFPEFHNLKGIPQFKSNSTIYLSAEWNPSGITRSVKFPVDFLPGSARKKLS